MPTSLPRLTPARQSTVSTLGSLVSRARQAIQPPKAKTKREQQKEELFSHYVLNKDPEASKYMPYDEVAYPSLVRKARDVGELQESAPQELEHCTLPATWTTCGGRSRSACKPRSSRS